MKPDPWLPAKAAAPGGRNGANATSGLSQSNHYYEGDVFLVCPLLLNLSRYPNSNVPI